MPLRPRIFERIDQRQRNLAFLQIAQHRLAQLLGGSREIQYVIHELERKSREMPVVGHGLLARIVQVPEDGAQPRASCKQTGRLPRRQLDSVIAPARIRGSPAPARVRAINYIIVDQRSAANQLHDRPEAHSAIPAIPRVARGQEQQRGPQALAASCQKVTGDLRHRLDRRAVLESELLLDFDQVLTNQVKDFLGRQKCDGAPPGPFLSCPTELTRPKNLRKFSAAALATSSVAKSLTFAMVRATSATYAGSFRFPRCGRGARNGESVSTSKRSSGICRATSRKFCAFG